LSEKLLRYVRRFCEGSGVILREMLRIQRVQTVGVGDSVARVLSLFIDRVVQRLPEIDEGKENVLCALVRIAVLAGYVGALRERATVIDKMRTSELREST
jgi:hypothetical protein